MADRGLSVSEEGNFYRDGGRGVRSWVFSTDHKRIGILYLVSVLSLFTLGVAVGLVMRL